MECLWIETKDGIWYEIAAPPAKNKNKKTILMLGFSTQPTPIWNAIMANWNLDILQVIWEVLQYHPYGDSRPRKDGSSLSLSCWKESPYSLVLTNGDKSRWNFKDLCVVPQRWFVFVFFLLERITLLSSLNKWG